MLIGSPTKQTGLFVNDAIISPQLGTRRIGKEHKCIPDRRRSQSSYILSSATTVHGDTDKPMPQTLLFAVLYIALARGVQLPIKSKVKSSKEPASVCFNL